MEPRGPVRVRSVQHVMARESDPVLEAMIRQATVRLPDPNDWTEEERELAIREGWLRRVESR